MATNSSIREFYSGKSILVTGGTGFMGKVLLEKLLYHIPNIGDVYVLMRPKKGKSIKQRFEDMQRLPLFDRIKNEKPSAFKKIIPLQGDVLVDNFGLSEREIENISEEISLVFHFAATLRLEAPLRDNVDMNTCGTQRALNVAKKFKNLLAFVHLSTAFCYPDYTVLEERASMMTLNMNPLPDLKNVADKIMFAEVRQTAILSRENFNPNTQIHAPPVKPSEVMHLIEWLDDKQQHLLTPSLLGPHPNCYTFSKRLAENVVENEFNNLPVVIARPSIVCPSVKEPMPGWVDSLNGPVGLMLGASKGVIRTMLCDGSLVAQVIPVDTAINAIIAIGMLEGSKTEKSERIPIYNVNIGHQKPTSWGEVLKLGKEYARNYPLAWPLWYPNGDITTNVLLHEFRRIFFHLLPAYSIDFLLFLLGQKRLMVRIQDRISQGLEVLQYFTMRPWNFPCPNYDSIQSKLNDEEKVIFNTDLTNDDRDLYLQNCLEGGRIYCFKEDPSKIPINRVYHNFLYVLDWAVKIFFWLLVFSFLATWFAPVKTIFSYGEPVVKRLPMLGAAVFDKNL